MKPRAPGRRRTAPAARESSDVTRFRGFGAGALTLVITVAALLALRSGPSALVTPGPLARPHQALACASCHEGSGAARAERACVGCHGAHGSVRPAHARLARAGELGCSSCHAVHRSESGLAFEASGAVTHYGSGFERALAGPTKNAVGNGPTFVPLVAREACTRCHDLDRGSDPAWACFGGGEGARESAFSLCFDEHRRPAERGTARGADRDAVVERARVIARQLPHERTLGLAAGSVTVAFGALAAGLAVVIGRRRAKAKRATVPARVVAVTPGARRLPVIDAARCLGCQACVDACPYEVLEMSRYVAVVARPESCCGAGPCLSACPNGSLELRAGPAPVRGPRIDARLESLDRAGVFLAGDVTGGSLIRRALEQGVLAARAAAEGLATASRPGVSTHDLVVVGAGPAGLAAALEGRRRGLGVVVLEQASIAESIRRFSREKLVLDAQVTREAELPLWIGDASKDELLRRWLREVHARGLDVREGFRVSAVEGASNAFRVRAVGPDGAPVTIAARRVVLATGRRGSPRKLDAPVPEAALGRVHYELSDARAFAGNRVVVVGLGDVAMETALALSVQPGTTVTLVHRGRGFTRGRQKNVEAIGRLVAEGRIGLLFETEVRRIGAGVVVVETNGQSRGLPFDALFVHVGTHVQAGTDPLSISE